MLNRYSLRTKLLGGFSAVVILMMGLGVFLLNGIKSTDAAFVGMIDNNVVPTQSGGVIRSHMWRINSNVKSHVLASDFAEMDKLEADNASIRGEMDKEFEKIRAVQTPEEKPFLDEYEKELAETRLLGYAKVIELSRAMKTEEAVAALKVNQKDNFEPARAALIKDIEYNTKTQNEISEKAQAATDTTTVTAWAVLGVAACIALGIAFFMAHNIGNAVRRSSENVDDAASNLSAIAAQMSANAEETATQSEVVAATVEQFTANMSAVAAAVEEMQVTVREIAENATTASQVAAEAVGTVENTNQQVSNLGESSKEIGKVIEVITSIAEQTNLLALNATIEAARAGEAGKGFAVVANEVKELAKETASATEEISKRIGTIQKDSGTAVLAMGDIAEVIAKINQMQSAIAAAVEEQTATTGEIARNVSDAAQGSEEVARSIAHVATAASDTSKGAATTKDVAIGITNEAEELRKVLEGGGHGPTGTNGFTISTRKQQPRRDFADAPNREAAIADDEARTKAASGKYRINN